jgi:hypothetical protein
MGTAKGSKYDTSNYNTEMRVQDVYPGKTKTRTLEAAIACDDGQHRATPGGPENTGSRKRPQRNYGSRGRGGASSIPRPMHPRVVKAQPDWARALNI